MDGAWSLSPTEDVKPRDEHPAEAPGHLMLLRLSEVGGCSVHPLICSVVSHHVVGPYPFFLSPLFTNCEIVMSEGAQPIIAQLTCLHSMVDLVVIVLIFLSVDRTCDVAVARCSCDLTAVTYDFISFFFCLLEGGISQI